MSKKLKKNVPELRFPEFEGDWKNDVIGNHVKEYKERVLSNTNLTIYTSSREGLRPQIEYFANREVSNENEYGVVPHGFFVYRHMSDDSTFKFNINDTGKKIAVSKEYPVFTTTENLNSEFLLYKLNYGNDFKQFAVIQEKGGTRTRLYLKNLCTWKTLIPSIAEQEKIASFLGAIASRLTQLRRKRELLQTYKRGVMQKLFSQQIRFKDEIGSDFPDWEEKILGEVANFSRGKGLSKEDLAENGNFKCIRYAELYTIYNEIIRSVISSTNLDSKDLVLSIENDVLIPSSGESASEIAKAACLKMSGVALGGDLNIIRSSINSEFLSYCLNHYKKNDIAKIAQGNTVVHLYSSQLAQIRIEFPSSKKEQGKIANFLTTIDRKIETLSRQIDQTEKFKKGLLQKMFV